ncbi:MAG: hypothetical protein OXO50_07175 [Caldilineaceae bacterium]|nr:hypothetical protein [Caldilineaceae bacterium]
MITIRPSTRTNDDYRLPVGIFNAVRVGQEEIVAGWQEGDEKRAKKLKWGRFFAEVDGQPVGYAGYEQHRRMNHPGKLWANVNVLPGTVRRLVQIAHATEVWGERLAYGTLAEGE